MALFRDNKTGSTSPARRRYAYNATGVDGNKNMQQQNKAVQYKRGRTLAGSTGARLRASESSALQVATPREKAHHLATLRRKVIGLLAVVGGISVFIFMVLWQLSADVSVQLLDQSLEGDVVVYETAIQRYLDENPTERLRFNLNEVRLGEFMSRLHPEVETVTQEGYVALAKTGFVITPRTPVASWQVGSSLYFVDAHGVSFTKNLRDTPQVTIIDNSGVQYTPGTAIASERFLGFVGRAVALSRQNQLNVTSVSIPAGTSRQVELIVEGVEYPLVLSIDRSPAEQVEDGLRAVRHFKMTGRVPLYVDLRVQGKAFFRE